MRMGYFDLEIGLYLRILFGLQLIDYILFALLVFVVHAVVNQKHARLPRGTDRIRVIVFPSTVGLEHHLLIYGSGPRWTYSDIRGFGPSLGPWLWFKLYWAAWAVLLAVAGRLLWARGTERSLWSRLQVARRRFTRATVGVAATAVALIVTLGGFIFYNTNSLNRCTDHRSEETRARRVRAALRKVCRGPAAPSDGNNPSRRDLSRSAGGGDPWRLRPREHQFRGDRLHPCDHRPGGRNRSCIRRPARVLACSWMTTSAHRIYALEKPLQPGDSLHLSFEVHVAPHGFRNDGSRCLRRPNGSHFTNRDWLPAIGYQRNRELDGCRSSKAVWTRPTARRSIARRRRGAPDPSRRRPDRLRSDRGDERGSGRGCAGGAPPHVDGRRATLLPLPHGCTHQQSVRCVLRQVRGARRTVEPCDGLRQAVAIQIFHHPGHAGNLGRMVASVRASLDTTPSVWSLPIQLYQADRESCPWHGCTNGSRDG